MVNKPRSNSAWQRDFERDPGGIESGWLAASWDDPQRFWEALFAMFADASTVAPKSVFGDCYDLYHDAVIRHLGQGRVALRWYEEDRGWQALTYDALHVRTSRLARAWTGSGVEAGAVVAVVVPFGVDYVIATLAGWRLGACVAPLEPDGRAYVNRRLAGLGPTQVATTALYHGMLADFSDILIDAGDAGRPDVGLLSVPAVRPGDGDSRSYTYAAGDPCAFVFSPLRQPSDQAWPLSCDGAYLGALRDGILVLGLGQDEEFSAPGFLALQTQPGLVLATLLQGATYVHLPMNVVQKAPERLLDRPLSVVGVSAAVREGLTKVQPGSVPWRHWFRNPEEAEPWTDWQAFIDGCGLGRVAASNIIYEAAAGGTLVASRAETGTKRMHTFMNAHPAAGVAWTLVESSGQETAGDVGGYAYGPDPVLSHVLLARYGGRDHLYMGTTEPRRAGWVYPDEEVCEALANLDYVDAASVVAVPSGSAYSWRFVLLLFTGYQGVAAPHGDAGRKREVEQVIAALVGERFLPDRIVMVPLAARRKDGAVDHDWCRREYVSGALHHKAKMPVFAHLTALRAALFQDDSP